ncbi:cell division cycle- protein [Dermatophagoides farinae]|uniref:Cell division cycle- protein n=1 Tax=Dermatophagoides farinae TaxID=6954 RepID=A0A922KZI6_DERFA|nr:cell division cycle- protein [Dermatophagoides farinae]
MTIYMTQQQQQSNVNVNDNSIQMKTNRMLVKAEVHHHHHSNGDLNQQQQQSFPISWFEFDDDDDGDGEFKTDPSYLLRMSDNQSMMSVDTSCSSIIDYNDDENLLIEDKVLNKLDNILMNAAINNDDGMDRCSNFKNDDDDNDNNSIKDDDDDDDGDTFSCCSKSSILCSPANYQLLKIDNGDNNDDQQQNDVDTTVIDNDHAQIICTTTTTTTTMNKGNFLRKIERFGTDVCDTCLFPLALPMDGSDIYRGHSTWESIDLLADCVLMLWTESSSSSSTTTTTTNQRSLNNVLGDPIRFLCFHSELMDGRKFPYVKSNIGRKYDPLPFRRWCSELDLRGMMANNDNQQQSESASSSVMVETEDADMILENFRRKSLTICRQFAYKQELQNPKRLAARITRLERQNFLQLTRREVLNYLFGKIPSNNQNLHQMIRFARELSQLVGCWILTETSVEGQKQTIATIIEVSFILFMRKNFQSFESIMRGLRLPSIYSLQESWRSLRLNNPIHFRIYHYLTTVITNQLQQKSSLICHSSKSSSSSSLSLPSLASFFETLRLRSLSIICRLIDEDDDNDKNGDHHHHHINVRNIGNQSLIDIINEYQYKDVHIRQKLNELTANERQRRLRRQRKQMAKMVKKTETTMTTKKRFWPFPVMMRKRKIKQQKEMIINNDDDDDDVTIAASYMSLLTKKFDPSSINKGGGFPHHQQNDDCLRSLRMYIEQQFIVARDHQPLMPDRWRIISIRNIGTNIHRLLTIEFLKLYKHFMEQIEQYRF